MDSLISAAARALARGDAIMALNVVALREDPPALALRGIAMAQLGELLRARELLRRAARAFGRHEALAQARCVVAEAEVALALRELGGSTRALATAEATLAARGDHANALQARVIAARRLLLLGRLQEAEAALSGLTGLAAPHRFDAGVLPPSLAAVGAVAELARAELAWRSLQPAPAHAALQRAQVLAERAQIGALRAEVAEAQATLARPAARRVSGGAPDGTHDNTASLLNLAEVQALLASNSLVLDGCRRGLHGGGLWRPLLGRPLLFELLRLLALAWPLDVARETLIASAFRTRHGDETHRARLRVEIGRLRALVAPLARIEATRRGFLLRPCDAQDVVLLAPPIEATASNASIASIGSTGPLASTGSGDAPLPRDEAALLALLADGAAWSSSALALALGSSQRTVQRALAGLHAAARVRCIGRARTRRWLAPPLAAFTTILLLPAALPIA